MAKGKKHELTLEEKLEQALVPEDEQPYELPNNWIWIKLESLLIEIKNGTTIKQDKSNTGYPVTRIESLQNNIIDFSRLGTIVDETKILENDWYIENDIALSHINSAEHVGKTALIKSNMLPMVHGMNLLRLRFNCTCIPKLFQYYSQSFQYKDSIIKRINMAVNQVSINQKQLGSIEFPLPPLEEQQRIVNRIESIFEKLDSAKELAQNALDSFETRKAVILHKAFTGELTAQWRDKNGIGIDSWLNKKLGDMTNIKSSKRIFAEEYLDEGVPFFRSTEVVELNDYGITTPTYYISQKRYDEIKDSYGVPSVGDLLVTSVGTIGKTWIVDDRPFYYKDGNLTQVEKCLDLDMRYLQFYINSEEFKRQVVDTVAGSAYNALTIVKFKAIMVTTPSIQEQLEIVRILGNLLEKEEKVKELCDVIEKIDLMKKVILARAFRGELGTNNPNEESASYLLKEILAKEI